MGRQVTFYMAKEDEESFMRFLSDTTDVKILALRPSASPNPIWLRWMAMISPPIIQYNWGDVEIFSSVEELERHIEPVDVASGEYLMFDSDGRILEMQVVGGSRVVVLPATSESRFQPQLTHLLLWFIERSRSAPPRGAGLQELIQTVASLQHRKRR